MNDTITLPNGRSFRVVSRGAPVVPTASKSSAKARKPKKPPIFLCGLPVAFGRLRLSTVPPSVNSLFHNRAKGRGKTLDYRNWQAASDRELRHQPVWHVPGTVVVHVIVGTGRGDVDNRLKATLDLLVSAGRIEDDKQVVKVTGTRDLSIAGTLIEIEARP